MMGIVARIDRFVAGWVRQDVLGERERRLQIACFRMLALAALALMTVLPIALATVLPVGTVLAASIGGSAMPLLMAAILSTAGSRAITGLSSMVLVAIAVLIVQRVIVLPSVVLPMSIAAPLAACLVYLGARLIVNPKGTVPEHDERPDAAPDHGAIYDRFAGLVLVHDRAGDVTGVHGADAGAFATWLTKPQGHGFYRAIHVADRLAFMQAVEAVRNGGTRQSVAIRMQRDMALSHEGQFVHLALDMTPLGEPGAVTGILTQARDVSAEKDERAALCTRVEQAERADAAKTRFLTAVSHEMRTPLNAIRGFSDVLAGDHVGPYLEGKQREYAGCIRQSGDHLLSLVNGLLDMSRVECGRYELTPATVDLAATIGRCEAMLHLQARERGVHLTSRIARHCAPLVADSGAIDQILINLVANAIKFTEKGGVVTIEAAQIGDRIRLSVSDTGVGIPAESLAVLGEPFVRGKSGPTIESEGCGLGICLTKGLVALHGGTFAIASEPGRGTVVTIEMARDGSGMEEARAPSETGGTVAIAFPPYLARREGNETETDAHDDAQARTA
ncbi:sensor histidine kinase [Pararhizobium mangrovi]|uniref:histidine kinase n=1 Tax=Pararhizobium mangrovi TaxID=2590452 RepID=A0A506UHE7_9HYPH|nr:HAMP domain-containing sensor histidine kinase [Pararhizobium mangrovi]TPW32728.1 PAS domain-containing sensor histidine kinase [Pararhizobium mangrovi]